MDNTDLTRIFTTMRSRLRLTAARIAGEADADDALQEAFLGLWSRGKKSESDSNAEALSLTAVRNRSIDMARQHKTRAASELNEATLATPSAADSEATRQELFVHVRQIIEQELPERQREVLWMRDYEQLSFAEIAEQLNLSEANVRQILSRARRQVRQIYKEKQYENYE